MNKLKFKSMLKKIGSIISAILISFILINLSFFSIEIYKNVYNKPNAPARTYLVPARAINYLYIFPLSDLFGYRNATTIPFYKIRDFLYNKGMSNFPSDSGEKEIWWWEIRFMEFHKYVMKEYYNSHTIRNKPYLEQYLRFKKWEEEVFSHIEPLSKADVKDTEFEKEKYAKFITMVDDYTIFTKSVLFELGRLDGKNYIKELLYKLDFVYKTYLNYKKYAKTNEKDDYDYYNNNPNMKVNEYIFVNTLSSWYLFNLMKYRELKCNEKYIDIYLENKYTIYDYFEKYNKSMSYGLFSHLSLIKTSNLLDPIGELCPKNKRFQKFLKLKHDEIHSNKVY